MNFKSTRGDGSLCTSSEAIIRGLAEDGGLFVPTEIPKPDFELSDLAAMDYKQTAFEILKKYLTDFTEEELKDCIAKAYDSKFDTEEIAPVVEHGGIYYLELFHGSTIAFKDMALSLLPYLLTTAAKKNNIKNDIVILTATSGDTGKAALAGFANVPGTKIIVFYPKGGVSNIQELLMLTQKGSNTHVVGVHGNFDDAQTEVKRMFSDESMKKLLGENGYQFSSANSINIGRLFPQVVYYFWTYGRLLKEGRIKAGDEINFVVPTGNFGNILAGYYAKRMGLPIHKLLCASNENKVLYDFFRTGTYDKNRDFLITTAPSMDILVSSNLERLIYMITGENEEETRKRMQDLSDKGCYSITPEMAERLDSFAEGYATEKEIADTIRRVYDESGYVIDTHTAVGAAVYDAYRKESGDTLPAVIISTASPYKFARSVMIAIDPANVIKTDIGLLDDLERISGVAEPQAIHEIKNAEILHTTICEINRMESVVKNFLQIK